MSRFSEVETGHVCRSHLEPLIAMFKAVYLVASMAAWPNTPSQCRDLAMRTKRGVWRRISLSLLGRVGGVRASSADLSTNQPAFQVRRLGLGLFDRADRHDGLPNRTTWRSGASRGSSYHCRVRPDVPGLETSVFRTSRGACCRRWASTSGTGEGYAYLSPKKQWASRLTRHLARFHCQPCPLRA